MPNNLNKPNNLDNLFINHAALVGYALSKALLSMQDGGQLRGEAAEKALAALPSKPSAHRPVELRMWQDAEAELKKLAAE